VEVRIRLQQAVRDENYEMAAELQKRLRELEGGP
jgi:hypothetical protein